MKTTPTALVTATLALIGTLLLVAAPAAPAQTRDRIPPALDDFANGAALPYGTLTVNVDVTENGDPVPVDSTVIEGDARTFPVEASVFFSTNAQASWTTVTLGEIAGASGGTWEGSFAIGAGDVAYYFLVHDDSSAAFGAPENAADVFPPTANLLADPADEPAGDAYTPASHAVDLTGAAFGYSDAHLYATLSNATGTWPFSGGLFGPWYVYSAIIDNPDAGEDSLAFALVYADVPLVSALTGLYVVDARDSSYARVGDIDAVVQGGKLHLRADLTDLFAQPFFGEANPSGCYSVGAGTATTTILGVRYENDRTHRYSLYRRTDVAVVGSNSPPTLDVAGWELAGESEPGFEPGSPGAGRSDVQVRFLVTYADPDGHLAVVRNAIVDGSAYEMVAAVPDHNYMAGVQYAVELTLAEGEHTYSFSFGDGVAAAETEPDTALIQSGIPGESDVVTVEIVSPETGGGEIQFECSLGGAPDGRLDIYDVAGRLVRRIELAASGGTVSWNLQDERGRRVASGVYFVALTSAAGRDDSKLVIVR